MSSIKKRRNQIPSFFCTFSGKDGNLFLCFIGGKTKFAMKHQTNQKDKNCIFSSPFCNDKNSFASKKER